MTRAGTIILVVGLIIILLIGTAAIYAFLTLGQNAPGTSSTSQTTRLVSSSTTTLSSPIERSSSSGTSFSSSTSTKSTISSSTVATSTSTSYGLQLLSAGAGPQIVSNLTTSLRATRFQSDGPGAGGNYVLPYYDNGNNWTMDGDIEPGTAFAYANSSGLTLTDQTCAPPHNHYDQCSPYWEWNGDNHEEAVSEVSSVLYGISPNLTAFTIDVVLPNYTGIFSSCSFNISSSGCSYEGSAAMVAANFALDAFGPGYDNSIAVSVTETATGMSFAAGTASIGLVNGQSKYLGGLNLGGFSEPGFTPDHKLTIVTDRKSFINLFAGNRLIYSNDTMPVDMNGTGFAVNFYQFTSANNESISTVWSNFTAYDTPFISVSGLQQGMSMSALGQNGFNSTVQANSKGTAIVDVGPSPNNIAVSIEFNGTSVATYPDVLQAGAKLNLTTTLHSVILENSSS